MNYTRTCHATVGALIYDALVPSPPVFQYVINLHHDVAYMLYYVYISKGVIREGKEIRLDTA